MTPDPHQAIAGLLSACRTAHDEERLDDRAVELAAALWQAADAGQSRPERQQQQRLARLMDDPAGRQFTAALADQLFRSGDAVRAGDQWRHLVERYGVPAFLPAHDAVLLRAGLFLARFLPETVLGLARRRMRGESANVILPAEDPHLARHLQRRRAQGLALNINHLGEAVLGDGEAEAKLLDYERLLRRRDVDCISVKISAVCSNLSVIAFDQSQERICACLRRIYRAALASPAGPVLVNLDMEAFHDLDLSMAAFLTVMAEEEFHGLQAGIALQAYLPDSWDCYHGVLELSRRRIAAGGKPLRVRLVKGANLQMEQAIAELSGWACPIFPDKAAVDAHFKSLVRLALLPEHAASLHVGVASHNLFDVAYALALRARYGCEQAVCIEMLEGMANHQARAVAAHEGDLLLYAPIVEEAAFQSAIAYLTRRLDENTAPANFLRALFTIAPGNATWRDQEQAFRRAVAAAGAIDHRSRRQQDRRRPAAPGETAVFTNDVPTDWTRSANRDWLAAQRPPAAAAPLTRAEDVTGVIAAASAGGPAWAAVPAAERRACMLRLADLLAAERGPLLALMATEGRKVALEADLEICEAIDFARYYPQHLHEDLPGAMATALGTVLVCPPWNFPLAIPCGGIVAALLAGNAVICKPAPETRQIAWRLCELCWQAGVPRAALHYLGVADDAALGDRLITDARIDAVILTGAAATAERFLSWRPTLRLSAETGGKNSMIITAMADRDQALDDLVHSAFGHAGQKCSAVSLAIIEAELYDDPAFRERLRDITASLRLGPAGDPATQVPPLIRRPGSELKRALTSVDAGQSWLLEPRQIGDDPCAWSPGIRLGVTPGSWFHQTECFGPVLGLMRARDLDHAITLANAQPFGLTAALHSLDEREHDRWLARIAAGNCYINRRSTGAIVQRQPFGGWKASRFGIGAKAGGPDYVMQFQRWSARPATPSPAVISSACRQLLERAAADGAGPVIKQAAAAVEEAWETWFSRGHDPSALSCERNVLRYLPRPALVLALGAEATIDDLVMALLPAVRLGMAIRLCGDRDRCNLAARLVATAVPCRIDHDLERADWPVDALLRALALTEGAEALLAHGQQRGCDILCDAPVPAGRILLLPYLRAQAVCVCAHRYGNRDMGDWQIPALAAHPPF